MKSSAARTPVDTDNLESAAERVVRSARRKSKNLANAVLPTLLADIDSALEGGLRRQELTTLVSEDAATLSALCIDVPFNIAAHYEPEVAADGTLFTRVGGVVAYFSTKLSSEKFATAIISAQTGIGVEEIERGDINETQFEALVQCSQMMQKLPLFIKETPNLSVDGLSVAARRIFDTRGLDVIFVDELTALSDSYHNITKELLILARDLDVAVVCVSTVSATEVSEDAEARVREFRVSSSAGTIATPRRFNLTPIKPLAPPAPSDKLGSYRKGDFLQRALELSDLKLSSEQLSPQPTPVAISSALGGPTLLGRKVGTSADLARLVQDGLPIAVLDRLLEQGFSTAEIEALVAPKRTLSRRRSAGRLTPVEGDTVVRFAKAYLLSVSAIGSESSALQWLRRKRKSKLGGRAPIELLGTETGGDVIEEMLLQVVYGVTA